MQKRYTFLFILFTSLHSFFVTPIYSQTIAGGLFFSLSTCLDSTVKSWGYNYYGELGLGDTIDRHIPTPIAGLTGIKAVDAGEWHSIALKNNGTVWSWGNNFNGQLGTGLVPNSSVPVQVFGLTNVRAIASGQNHCLALKSDSTIRAWGNNLYGQVGDGTTNLVACQCKPSAVPVSNLNNVIAIASGGFHSLALKSDSTLWAWGRNTNGQLGDSTNNDSSLPIQVHGLSGIVAISAGGIHSLALKSDGTVYAWGGNLNGQLGDSTINDKNFPVKLNGLTNVMAISAGYNHSMILKTDSTIWSWGYNYYSQVGDGTLVDKHFPVSGTGLTGIAAIDAGGSHSIVLKNNFSLKAWGNSYYGLGDGTVVTFGCECRMFPINVTNWCSPLSVEENSDDELSLVISPNPCALQFQISDFRFQISNVKVINVLGEVVISNWSLINNKNITIDLSREAKGIYFLEIQTDKRIINRKIIVQ